MATENHAASPDDQISMLVGNRQEREAVTFQEVAGTDCVNMMKAEFLSQTKARIL